jgi:hypothetical protein
MIRHETLAIIEARENIKNLSLLPNTFLTLARFYIAKAKMMNDIKILAEVK